MTWEVSWPRILTDRRSLFGVNSPEWPCLGRGSNGAGDTGRGSSSLSGGCTPPPPGAGTDHGPCTRGSRGGSGGGHGGDDGSSDLRGSRGPTVAGAGQLWRAQTCLERGHR